MLRERNPHGMDDPRDTDYAGNEEWLARFDSELTAKKMLSEVTQSQSEADQLEAARETAIKARVVDSSTGDNYFSVYFEGETVEDMLLKMQQYMLDTGYTDNMTVWVDSSIRRTSNRRALGRITWYRS